MKGFFGALFALLLVGAAVAAGVMMEKKHSEGAFSYPWEKTSQSSSASSGSKSRYAAAAYADGSTPTIQMA